MEFHALVGSNSYHFAVQFELQHEVVISTYPFFLLPSFILNQLHIMSILAKCFFTVDINFEGFYLLFSCPFENLVL